MTNIPLGLTFDDVLLVPKKALRSRNDADIRTRLSKNIKLNIPLISSNMDTVTEETMAIAMAREGGIGILHRFCSIEHEVDMVKKVKRAESYIIYEPYTLFMHDTIENVFELIEKYKVFSFLVLDQHDRLIGLLTHRDWKHRNKNEIVYNCMTKREFLITGKKDISIDEARKLMVHHKIQKLPLTDDKDNIYGLICMRDIERIKQRPNANLDSKGRLVVGASIGVKDGELFRARKLIEAGVDVIVIDVAHGHSDQCIETLRELKNQFPNTDVIAGNVATAEGAEELILNGADGIKVSIGAGSICITRIVSGAGVPQLTALLNIYPICKKYGIPMISDGGNRNSGNICKALAAGASSVMLGRMIAGADESPGKVLVKNGERMKIIRGMAGLQANISNAIKNNMKEPDALKFSAEGVEGFVSYIGPVKDTLGQICAGIKSGMSYCGSRTIEELQNKREFIRVTNNGNRESGVHDIKN